MQMAYSEEELDEQMEVINNRDAVPKVLNDAEIDVDRVVYNGDMKKKDVEEFAKTFDDTKNSI